MKELALRAHAKINLALEVRGLRPDGYHEISTILQSISLADVLRIEAADKGLELLVEPKDAAIGAEKENTVFLAWKLLSEYAGGDLPARIQLSKRIPSGAGLGGGSADAAAALVGLNGLFELGLEPDELRVIGGRIGADVPFCISGGTALGEGIGDLLSPLPEPPPHGLVVAKPAASAETATIYRAHDERPHESRGPVTPVVEALQRSELRAFAAFVGNDLSPVTEKLIPAVGDLEVALVRAGALGAAMSGTGSAVYGIFGSRDEARSAAEELRRTPAAAFVEVCEPVGRGVEVL